MDKDEMKNRISMALKDPVLQQGFEVICKENAELKEDLEIQKRINIEMVASALDRTIRQLTKAKELLRFWVNNFYDSFNHTNKYEAKHKALVETEQFLKEIEK